MHWQWGNQWAVRRGEWKLIGRGANGQFLANLKDPQPEQKNHRKAQPDLAKELALLHSEWTKDVTPKR